ncbi:MAG: MFS transporter, partial [Armatimonadota bacterium]|nr:MFS transporter [Armatimonadota bacterium]
MNPAEPPGYRRLLRENAHLRALWSGQLISQVGDVFSSVAVVALLIERTGGAAGQAVAWQTIARHLPAFLLAPAAGAAADRFDRRRVMIAADLVRALLALGYLVVLAGGPVWVLYLVSAGLSGVSIFFNTARAALLPVLATRAQLMVANALSAATFGTTLAVGSLAGGVVSATVGRAPAFL